MSINNASIDERIVATQLVDALLRRGIKVTVNDGEEETVTDSLNRSEILEALCTTDEDHVGGGDFDFWLLWGNGGDGLIADFYYTSTHEEADAIYNEALALTNNQ